jgi:hypothetical protein
VSLPEFSFGYRDGTTHAIFEPSGEPKPKRPHVTSQFGERPAEEGRAGIKALPGGCAREGYDFGWEGILNWRLGA